jgi:hypothetical protein
MDEDKDLRNALSFFGIVLTVLIIAIWSYNMFGPDTDASVAMQRGYVQKVVPVPATTTIWTKP